MELFKERIDKVKQLVGDNKIEEAFIEYKTLVLLVNRLDIDNLEISKKVKILGDEIILKILKKKLNEDIKIKEKYDFDKMIEVRRFYDTLKEHNEICNMIQNEDYNGALRKFRNVKP